MLTACEGASSKDDGEAIDSEGVNPGDCTDGLDNDEDGQTDCYDDGCAGSPDCASGEGEGEGEGGGEGEGEGEGEICEAVVSDVSPADGTGGVYIHTRLSVWVTAGERVYLRLFDASGAEVYGTSDLVATVDGMDQLAFSPFDPLSPSSTYTASASYCSDEQLDWSFTTSTHGDPLNGCDPLEGWYAIDLASANTDPLVGVSLLSLVPGDLFIGFGPDTGGRVEMFYTTGPGAPDVCREPEEVFGPRLDLPEVWVEGGSWSMFREGLEISNELVELHAHIDPECGTISGRLRLIFDLRRNDYGLSDVLGTSAPDEACSLLDGTHTPCVPCEDGERYCVEVYIDQLRGSRTADAFHANSDDWYAASRECVETTDACGCSSVERNGPWHAVLMGMFGLLAWRRRGS